MKKIIESFENVKVETENKIVIPFGEYEFRVKYFEGRECKYVPRKEAYRINFGRKNGLESLPTTATSEEEAIKFISGMMKMPM